MKFRVYKINECYKESDYKINEFYAWFPIFIKGEIRWFEHVKVFSQLRRISFSFFPVLSFTQKIRFLDIEERSICVSCKKVSDMQKYFENEFKKETKLPSESEIKNSILKGN